MKIDFREIESGRTDYEFDAAPSEVDFDCAGVYFKHDIVAKITVISTGDEVVISGYAATSIIVECDRCLKELSLPLEVKLRLIIHRKEGFIDMDTGDDDFIVISKSAGVYDLRPHIREAFVIELPAKRLCRIDCQGLCPTCGIDLNVGSCDCSGNIDSGYWDELQKIKNKKIEN